MQFQGPIMVLPSFVLNIFFDFWNAWIFLWKGWADAACREYHKFLQLLVI